jgi:hypothetical protein
MILSIIILQRKLNYYSFLIRLKNMKKNVGSIDQIVRYLLAAVIIALFLLKVVTGTLGFILLGVAAVFIITSALNFCPIWWMLGLKTNKAKK